MQLDDLFREEPETPNRMGATEFKNKCQALLNRIVDHYHRAWQSRALTDEQRPPEEVCDRCKGQGLFQLNGITQECYQDRELGDCYWRSCDLEEVGEGVEAQLDAIYEILSVDELTQESQPTR